MAEILSKQTGKDLSPDLRKRFSEVQHVKEAGRIAIYGIDIKTKKKKRIGVKDYVKAWDKKPEPQRVPGVWYGGAGDRPVIIVGTYGKGRGGEEYLRAQGTKEKIPRSKIEWFANGDKQGGRVQELEEKLAELSKRFEKFEQQQAAIEKENHELKEQKQALEAQNRDLQDQVDKFSKGELTTIVDVNNRSSGSRPRGYFNKATGWVGSKIPWRSQPDYANRRIEERNGKPVMVVTEEQIDGYPAEDRRRGAAVVLGTLAAIGVGILAAGLWGEHEEQEGRDSVTPPVVTTGPHISHGDLGRRTVLFHGSKAFQVSLPGNLEWDKNANGSYRIEDTTGHDIVPHVYADQQGNLDIDSRELLRTDPYEELTLKQIQYEYHTPRTNFDHHYMTVVEND